MYLEQHIITDRDWRYRISDKVAQLISQLAEVRINTLAEPGVT